MLRFAVLGIALAMMFPASGLALDEPVLTATQPWEQAAVFEPTVLYDARRELYRMWYSGGWDVCAMGYADSRDAVHWNKHQGPVLGAGVGGVTMACRNMIVRDGLKLYAYFTDGDGRTRIAVGPDGIHWKVEPEAVITTPAWAPRDSTGIANTFVWKENGRWQMIYDVNMIDHWITGHASGDTPFSFHDDGPVSGLVGRSNGAPWVIRTRDGYDLYYLATTGPGLILPTDIYLARSTSLGVWRSSVMVLEHVHSWWQDDQVADPSIANGLLFFDGVDNARAVAAIGVVTLGE